VRSEAQPSEEGSRGPSRAGTPGRPLDPAELAKRRQGAKTHPAVLQVMEVLDADLRNVHTEERP
jgi:hypothetical protein